MSNIERLRRYMNKKELTLDEVARRLGYTSRSTIAHWFRRESIPDHKLREVKRLVSR